MQHVVILFNKGMTNLNHHIKKQSTMLSSTESMYHLNVVKWRLWRHYSTIVPLNTNFYKVFSNNAYSTAA